MPASIFPAHLVNAQVAVACVGPLHLPQADPARAEDRAARTRKRHFFEMCAGTK